MHPQIDSRDREIVRLNSMLIGGRPPAALGKDCCYKGVGTLSKDVATLQKQKVSLQADLRAAVDQQHKVQQREMALAKRNRVLEQELQKLEDVALHIEEAANEKLRVKEDELERLQVCDKVSERLVDFNFDLFMSQAQYVTAMGKSKASRDLENDSIQNRAILSRSREQIGNLQTELDRVLKHGKAKIEEQMNVS